MRSSRHVVLDLLLLDLRLSPPQPRMPSRGRFLPLGLLGVIAIMMWERGGEWTMLWSLFKLQNLQR
jgi:hypothetical protein